MIRDCTHARARHKHGTLLAYVNDACRCRPCKDAHATNARQRRRMQAYGLATAKSIPNIGARRRVEALACQGWSMQVLSQRLGWVPERLGKIFIDGAGISPVNAAKIAELYELLWGKPAPAGTLSERIGTGRVRALATRRGYLPPLAWDDIDNDPTPVALEPDHAVDEIAIELACSGRPVALTMVERLEAIRILHGRRLSDREIGERLGISGDAVCQERLRKLAGAA